MIRKGWKPGDAQALTDREKQVAQLIVDGFTSAEIAKSMKVSVKTIEAHRANMYKKLRICNTAQLMATLLRDGVVKVKGVKVA